MTRCLKLTSVSMPTGQTVCVFRVPTLALHHAVHVLLNPSTAPQHQYCSPSEYSGSPGSPLSRSAAWFSVSPPGGVGVSFGSLLFSAVRGTEPVAPAPDGWCSITATTSLSFMLPREPSSREPLSGKLWSGTLLLGEPLLG